MPVDAPDSIEHYVNRFVYESRQDVKRDHFEWALRFDVGDKVVCCNGGRWIRATVRGLWPTDSKVRQGPDNMTEVVKPYECEVDRRHHGQLPPSLYIIGRDKDEHIKKSPTSFRFCAGDKVIFDADKAAFNKRPPRGKQWIDGTYADEQYAVYEISLPVEKNKAQTGFIPYWYDDDDEHIASSEAYPRQQLLDAITQGCSCDHIHYLVTELGLDVSAFKDLVIEKAIHNGSYGALQWLEEVADVELEKIIDVDGNGLLHQIVKGLPNTRAPFLPGNFKFRSMQSFQSTMSYTILKNASFGLLARPRNKIGELFLHSLVLRQQCESAESYFLSF